MNVSAAGRLPAHVHRPQRPAGGEAPQQATTDTTQGTTDGSATSSTDAVEGGDAPSGPGGSDTPFTHALHQGNGKKLGIVRRMPTPEDVAAEQTAAGLDPTGGEATSTDGTAPADGTAPVDGATTVDGGEPGTTDGTIGIDGSGLGIGGDPALASGLDVVLDSPTPDELLEEEAAVGTSPQDAPVT